MRHTNRRRRSHGALGFTFNGARRTSRDMHVEPLEDRRLLAAEPIISEFVADNDGQLIDGLGEASDWIELFNAGDQWASLDG